MPELMKNEADKNANIMIVDDELSNVKLLEKMIAAAGYKNFISTTDPTKVVS